MSQPDETIYRASAALVEGEFREDAAVVVRDGDIDRIVDGDDVDDHIDALDRVVDLGDVALLPGQINVHSHAFQRALRGRTEYRRSPDEEDDFWTWRTEMYRLANRLDADQMETVARMAFLEMTRRGITRVGEFHYLHHRPDGSAYDEPMELAHRIARAAADVGIRLTLLPVAYHTGGIGEDPEPQQRRFIHGDVDTYLNRIDDLRDHYADEPGVDVGLAPHSIRAVDRDWMEPIAEFADRNELPVHIHVCEQPAEVEASRRAWGTPPVETLHDWGVLDDSWTLIHGTHLSERELEILEDVRPTIGACPTTERNLGDGFVPAYQLVERDVPIALGTDSHTVIDPFEEMRIVEYHERLRHRRRNVLVEADGTATATADVLWPMGTHHGARSLQSGDGSLREGGPADFVAIDLDDPSIAGATLGTLLTDVVSSMSAAAIRDVIIDGQSVVAERHHRREHDIVDQYRRLTGRLDDPSTTGSPDGSTPGS